MRLMARLMLGRGLTLTGLGAGAGCSNNKRSSAVDLVRVLM